MQLLEGYSLVKLMVVTWFHKCRHCANDFKALAQIGGSPYLALASVFSMLLGPIGCVSILAIHF
jgi:hypothetical protein